MRSLRRVGALVVGVVLAVSGAACSSGDDGGGTTSTVSAPETTVADAVAAVEPARIESTLASLAGERATTAQREKARATIRAALTAAGVEVTDEPFGTDGVNVLGRIPPPRAGAGTVLISAHYDTVPGSPGADDNASGVVAVLELARVLARTKPDVAVKFAFFDLEEAGLQGSTFHVTNHRTTDGELLAAYNLDMVGYSCDEPGCQVVFPDIEGCLDSEGARDIGVGIAGVADEQSGGLLDEFVAARDAHVPNLHVGTGKLAGHGECLADTRRSDHAPFWDAGVPTVFLTDTANFRNPNYHRPSDALATVDQGQVTDVTRALAAAVATKIGLEAG